MNGAGLSGVAGRLHSRYRPEIEAERYIEALNPAHDIDFFVLVEPGLGYLVDALRRHRPNGKAIVLHADSAFRESGDRLRGVPVRYPDDGNTVQQFLEREIPEGAKARIIEWRPSLAVYGRLCLDLVRESAEFIKRADASRRTARAFGKRWVRNFFRNLTLFQNVLLCGPIDRPVVVTGSGPSLEASLPRIRAAREGVFVLASSSSLPALTAGGIRPDMVIGTDGGGWALMHLHACFRLDAPPRLACALSAAIPSRCSESPVLPLGDGSLWQTLALNAAGVPWTLVPQRGTVTASALELALSIGSGQVFMAGMDLSVGDIRSHARPYGFDHLFFGAASRLSPVYSQAFVRSDRIRAGGSHDVYAAWFRSRLESWRGRVFSLGGGHGIFDDGPFPRPPAKGSGRSLDGFRAVPARGLPAQRCGRALDALVAALGDPGHSATLVAELAPLLLPDARPGDPALDLAEALRDIAGRYLGASPG